MTIADRRWTALPVPFAMEFADRVPKERYYDPEFYALENEMFWPRVWQMACRLEEIPEPGDFVEYEILDQSIVVVRLADMSVRAFDNACRHRGVKLVEGSGTCPAAGFTCSFHGWCFGLDGANTFLYQPDLFAEHNRVPEDLDLTPVRVELWGGAAWINLDEDAPPLRETIEPFASKYDEWQIEDLKIEWWVSCRLPTNWKLAMEAFMEGYHVMETHPQLNPPGTKKTAGKIYKTVAADGTIKGAYTERTDNLGSKDLIDTNLHFMKVLGEGMAGMIHENDVRIAEGLRDLELPDDPAAAMTTWRTTLNDAVVKWHRARGSKIPDLNGLDRKGVTEVINFCFPHVFFLPSFSSASGYRIRPLGPEECLFELYSYTRYPEDGAARPRPTAPVPMGPDDIRWPPIPKQDFSNLPKQQKGLHAKGFEFMRLSEKVEGLISNFQRTLDGYLAGLPYEQLIPAMQATNTTIDVPINDFQLEFGS